MFFSLGRIYDHRFPIHQSLGNWRLSHDPGWQGTAKGYGKVTDDQSNFVEFRTVDDDIEMINSRCRSFPLWWDAENQRLTNMLGQGQKIYVDQTVKIINGKLDLTPIDVYNCDNNHITLEQAVTEISQLLILTMAQQATQFGERPIRFYHTGGADTTLLLSVIQNLQLGMEFLHNQYFEYDLFCQQNWQAIATDHWAYAQLHHWCEPCVLLSGACGDEFMLRGPDSMAVWAAWHDIDVNRLVRSTDCYHAPYFKRDKNQKTFADAYTQRKQIQQQYPKVQDLNQQIVNMIANDFQHWHLGKTLTWTPLRSLAITKTLLKLPPEVLLGQLLNADINSHLIEKIHSPSLGKLDKYKNVKDGSDFLGRTFNKDGDILLLP